MQISIVDVDENGRALGTSTNFALCGPVRSMGEGDDSINRLATRAGCECSPCLVAITFSLDDADRVRDTVLRNVWQHSK